MKKLLIRSIILLGSFIFLAGCKGGTEHELATHFNSQHPGPAMPYKDASYLLEAVPEGLPFSFNTVTEDKLLGTVEDGNRESGTILIISKQSAQDILTYYTNLLTDSAFIDERELYHYHVFFPSEGNKATFCGEEGNAVFLEIFEMEDGAQDVRIHYTSDKDVLERTRCDQPALTIEDVPFPYLAAPPNAQPINSGGGGGGSNGRRAGFGTIAIITSADSLGAINDHYLKLLTAEGWILLNQSSTANSLESDWDFGYHETRSWLARLLVSTSNEPGQYQVELRAVSP